MLWNLFEKSDIVKWPLALFSVLALAIVIERLVSLSWISNLENRAYEELRSDLQNGDSNPVTHPELVAAPISQIFNTLLTMRGASFDALQAASEIAIGQQRIRYRRYLTFLATIGSTAPFIGLFGTVIGVLEAFDAMSKAGNNMEGSAVAGNIGAALSATAVGLLVAIPSVMAYNFLVGHIQHHVLQLSSHVAQLMPYLESNRESNREIQGKPIIVTSETAAFDLPVTQEA